MRQIQVHWVVAALLSLAVAGWIVWVLGARQAGRPPARPDAVALPREWAALIHQFEPAYTPRTTSIAEGESLSQVHCQICHLRPTPSILPLVSWLEVFEHHVRIAAEGSGRGAARLALPPKALRDYRIPRGDLANIIVYFLASAPQSVPPAREPPFAGSAPFEVVHAEAFNPMRPSMFSLASIAKGGQRVVLGDVVDKSLLIVEPNGDELHRIPLSGVATGLVERADGLVVTLIGPEPYSTNEASGKVVRLETRALDSGAGVSEVVMLSGLRRPVHTTFFDLDLDGQDELLIEEFGFSEGSLGYYDPVSGIGKFEYRVLVDLSGTVSAHVGDFNQDGLVDVVGMISQQTDAVFMLWGRADGAYEQEIVKQYHPAFGANQLLVGDMNGDGATDLVVVNGDRMDLRSHPIADYHGVRVLVNDGHGRFEEKFSYPLVGAVQAVLHDFDSDGDLDIVAVSATPDFSRRPLRTAVYLENQGGLEFLPHRIPGTERGCWSVVAAGDLDGDGAADLVLGAAYLPAFFNEISEALGDSAQYSRMILRNTSGVER